MIDARFTDPEIQEGLDVLSRRAQGQPDNTDVAGVPWQMDGAFQMSGGRITFPKLDFALPGAKAAMAGTFVFAGQELDFRGTARVTARVSQMMMTQWKRWALKAVDPYFAKDGYGTVVDFKISGTRDKPVFGLDRGDGRGAGRGDGVSGKTGTKQLFTRMSSPGNSATGPSKITANQRSDPWAHASSQHDPDTQS